MTQNRICNFLNGNIIHPFILNNYDKTKNGRKIASLKNLYIGKRCFFVGNGPSLSINDLDKLRDNKEITFGFNRIYKIFDKTDWRPTFYISQDEKILFGSIQEVNKICIPYKFIPIQMKWYFGLNIDKATYFNLTYQKDNSYKFSFDSAKQIYSAETCMYSAFQFAIYMGFKDIYFIGVDHHFHRSVNNKGEIVIDNNAADYFCDSYNSDKNNLYIPNIEKSTKVYEKIKEIAADSKIRVRNATRGGKLEVFQRISFDDLF